MPEPLTITDAAGFIRRGELTPVELLEQCFVRIDRYEERVRAWVYLDRDRARQEAVRLTAELKGGQNRGPLHGIPIGVKDIIDVFDMPTGCGSRLWANSYARRDATVVERLRQAGAVIMGKTVTTAFASFDPPVTRNPWNLERTPGGSSSGSAAAVACGMCLGALATQTGGSITRPASYCGVYSIKPTYGRVSVDGVMPLAPSMDHLGAMANCVRDLAILFQAIAGPDERIGVAYGMNSPIPDCLELFDNLPIEQEHSTRLTGLFDELISPELRGLIDERLLRSKSNNYFVRRHAVPPSGFAELLRAHRIIMAVEAAKYHGSRLAQRPDDYPPHIRELIEEGSRTKATAYREARLLRDNLEYEVNQCLIRGEFFLTPATTELPPDVSTTGSPAFNSPWSFTGQPTVSVPAGWSRDGLPFAIQLIGSSLKEAELLATAAWYERGLGFERRPLPL
jgi:Asp-tRNA(Asn)/Glu-tRNA(Gln) amidotransferase A subunit family amidase